MYKIVVIGIGNLGKRHVQSLLKSEFDMEIYCTDPVDSNFNEIKAMESECMGTKKVFYTNSIDELPKEIDFAIIATSSFVRRNVFEELVEHRVVRNLIFEKVLFPKISDYKDVYKLLNEKKINAWVNCARREWESWQEVKKEIDGEDIVSLDISGTEWGLACNGIHMLDLARYFDATINVEYVSFDSIINSKRKGYKELYGKIIGSGTRCKHLAISCYCGKKIDCIFKIQTDKRIIIVNEKMGIKQIISIENNDVVTKEFKVEYQSCLTQKSVKNIFDEGITGLPTYVESMDEHIQLLEPMIDFFEKNGGEKGICPIT
ncbi:Predicted dehydrogenase [Pseudobutyrivibrio sp. AR14]|uniref:Gfo/Idh/MocA family oxidoreductase n=1 Tax=Pseudobutyrivibrio sp. AR14 TaxID=1520804 RepID=UPI000885A73A|nr:Gfo/Idh/MocA family oxidoreductase [Pseudobutyrivibrio sp. AR14]SCY45012.1 Predicted dehydrogenase [Pseudobutyrivibrio sp. AR14]